MRSRPAPLVSDFYHALAPAPVVFEPAFAPQSRNSDWPTRGEDAVIDLHAMAAAKDGAYAHRRSESNHGYYRGAGA